MLLEWCLVEGEIDKEGNGKSWGVLSLRKSEEKETDPGKGREGFDRGEGREGNTCRFCGFGGQKWIQFISDGFYFLCKMSKDVDKVRGGEKFDQCSERERKCVISHPGRWRNQPPVNHSRVARPLRGGCAIPHSLF
uniref:Uncharacterized protein n=1 Tax=Molossus molossus TaxID=27622 RepID=A0A7J8GQJ1_MOLMO|nr:hypothetical protein HJG59_011282 [Molossus molossus]